MARYSQLVKQTVVPEDVRQIVHDLCVKWDEGFGYSNKKYVDNETYQLQLLINSNLGEAAVHGLLQQPAFRAEVNAVLAEHPELLHTHIGENGNYRFNNATGYQTDDAHDILDVAEANPNKKGWCDLIYYGQFDQSVVWSIEVKNTVTESQIAPSNFHKADLVFVLYNDSKEIRLLAPTLDRKSRDDSCYINLGVLQTTANPGYKKVLRNWEIIDF